MEANGTNDLLGDCTHKPLVVQTPPPTLGSGRLLRNSAASASGAICSVAAMHSFLHVQVLTGWLLAPQPFKQAGRSWSSSLRRHLCRSRR